MDCCEDDHRLRVRAALPSIRSDHALIFSRCDRQAISDLSFSYDGEYLAIAGAGSYIDIVRTSLYSFFSEAVIQGVQCATETGLPLHRVPALASSPKVTWHPSNYVIAYCGQTKLREGGPAPVAVISLFGPGL
jgi:THO complex subunit 3